MLAMSVVYLALTGHAVARVEFAEEELMPRHVRSITLVGIAAPDVAVRNRISTCPGDQIDLYELAADAARLEALCRRLSDANVTVRYELTPSRNLSYVDVRFVLTRTLHR